MNKKLLPLLLSILLLSACGQAPTPPTADHGLQIVATTYPVYLFASEVIKGVEGISVTPLVNQPVGCLHDYTLSVNDMKCLEGADVIALSGAGLEDFMADSLKTTKAPVLDCSEGVSLLSSDTTASTDGTVPADPHIWLDPTRAAQMVQNLANGLAKLDPDHAEQYLQNAKTASTFLLAAKEEGKATLSNLSSRALITFHEGFSYFAEAFDLTILKAIEEEAGSEASAKEIAEIVSLVQTHQLPAIFTEVNGSDATSQAISRETGVKVAPLSTIMSGDTKTPGVDTYLSALRENLTTLSEMLG